MKVKRNTIKNLNELKVNHVYEVVFNDEMAALVMVLKGYENCFIKYDYDFCVADLVTGELMLLRWDSILMIRELNCELVEV